MISNGPEFSPFLSAGALICQTQPTRPPPSFHVVTVPVCARHLLRAFPVPLALCSQGPTERSLQKQLWCSLPQRPRSAAGGKGTCLGWVPQALPARRALHCALGTAPPLCQALPRGFSAASFPTRPTSPGTVSQTVKTKRCPPPLRSWRLARGLAHGGSAWVGEREGEPSVRLCPLGSQPSSQGHWGRSPFPSRTPRRHPESPRPAPARGPASGLAGPCSVSRPGRLPATASLPFGTRRTPSLRDQGEPARSDVDRRPGHTRAGAPGWTARPVSGVASPPCPETRLVPRTFFSSKLLPGQTPGLTASPPVKRGRKRCLPLPRPRWEDPRAPSRGDPSEKLSLFLPRQICSFCAVTSWAVFARATSVARLSLLLNLRKW